MADLESSLFQLDQLDFFDQQQNQDLVSPRGQPARSLWHASKHRTELLGHLNLGAP